MRVLVAPTPAATFLNNYCVLLWPVLGTWHKTTFHSDCLREENLVKGYTGKVPEIDQRS